MSQVTEQSVRFQTALASIKLIQASAVLDLTEDDFDLDRKSGSAGMPRPISYAVFCLKKKNVNRNQSHLREELGANPRREASGAIPADGSLEDSDLPARHPSAGLDIYPCDAP